MAVTQTIQEDNTTQRTGVRYYTLAGPVSPSTAPTLVYQGDFQDVGSTPALFYWMPSNAIDKNQNIGYTYSVGNGTTDPSPYMARIDLLGTESTPAVTASATGADASDNIWGEYVSVSIDPDNVTFWGTGEYFDTTQTQCPGEQNNQTTCKWQTQIFNCYKGNGFCP